MGVSRSGYYAYIARKAAGPTEREIYNEKLKKAIKKHFYESQETYGSPRVHQMLLRDGFVVSLKTVVNRMREMGLYSKARPRRMKTTDSNHHNPIYENKLKREFDVEELNQVWVTDITYVHTLEGTVYLNPIMDLCSRKIISHTIDDTMVKELCVKALKYALNTRQPEAGFLHHSDRGSQYTSKDYTDLLKDVQGEISMSRKGDPYDNACMESFFATLKKELLYRWVFETKDDAIAAINLYIEFYNRKRIHSSLGYLTPDEYERQMKRPRENLCAKAN